MIHASDWPADRRRDGAVSHVLWRYPADAPTRGIDAAAMQQKSLRSRRRPYNSFRVWRSARSATRLYRLGAQGFARWI